MDRLRARVKAGQLKTKADLRAGCAFPRSTSHHVRSPLATQVPLRLPSLTRSFPFSLQQSVAELLAPRTGSSELQLGGSGGSSPSVVLVVGVNGGGKTTSIGKLAHALVQGGASVRVVPGDTFRAAAAEQLQEWATRSGASFHTPVPNSRPHSVLYSALDDAATGRAVAVDVLLCDTSGRLHTDGALMAELAKCKQTLAKRLPGAPHETLLVLDGTTGGNMGVQARAAAAAAPPGVEATCLNSRPFFLSSFHPPPTHPPTQRRASSTPRWASPAWC